MGRSKPGLTLFSQFFAGTQPIHFSISRREPTWLIRLVLSEVTLGQKVGANTYANKGSCSNKGVSFFQISSTWATLCSTGYCSCAAKRVAICR